MQNILFSLWILFHPVHVTLTSIDLVPGTDSIKVFVKIYYDDYLKDCCGTDINGKAGELNGLSDETMLNYLSEKVKIKIDNKLLKGKLIKMDLYENEVSVNMFYRLPKNPESITVGNKIMTTLYADQSNMVILRMPEFEEGFKLTPEVTERTFKLNKPQKKTRE